MGNDESRPMPELEKEFIRAGGVSRSRFIEHAAKKQQAGRRGGS